MLSCSNLKRIKTFTLNFTLIIALIFGIGLVFVSVLASSEPKLHIRINGEDVDSNDYYLNLGSFYNFEAYATPSFSFDEICIRITEPSGSDIRLSCDSTRPSLLFKPDNASQLNLKLFVEAKKAGQIHQNLTLSLLILLNEDKLLVNVDGDSVLTTPHELEVNKTHIFTAQISSGLDANKLCISLLRNESIITTTCNNRLTYRFKSEGNYTLRVVAMKDSDIKAIKIITLKVLANNMINSTNLHLSINREEVSNNYNAIVNKKYFMRAWADNYEGLSKICLNILNSEHEIITCKCQRSPAIMFEPSTPGTYFIEVVGKKGIADVERKIINFNVTDVTVSNLTSNRSSTSNMTPPIALKLHISVNGNEINNTYKIDSGKRYSFKAYTDSNCERICLSIVDTSDQTIRSQCRLGSSSVTIQDFTVIVSAKTQFSCKATAKFSNQAIEKTVILTASPPQQQSRPSRPRNNPPNTNILNNTPVLPNRPINRIPRPLPSPSPSNANTTSTTTSTNPLSMNNLPRSPSQNQNISEGNQTSTPNQNLSTMPTIPTNGFTTQAQDFFKAMNIQEGEGFDGPSNMSQCEEKLTEIFLDKPVRGQDVKEFLYDLLSLDKQKEKLGQALFCDADKACSYLDLYDEDFCDSLPELPRPGPDDFLKRRYASNGKRRYLDICSNQQLLSSGDYKLMGPIGRLTNKCGSLEFCERYAQCVNYFYSLLGISANWRGPEPITPEEDKWGLYSCLSIPDAPPYPNIRHCIQITCNLFATDKSNKWKEEIIEGQHIKSSSKRPIPKEEVKECFKYIVEDDPKNNEKLLSTKQLETITEIVGVDEGLNHKNMDLYYIAPRLSVRLWKKIKPDKITRFCWLNIYPIYHDDDKGKPFMYFRSYLTETHHEAYNDGNNSLVEQRKAIPIGWYFNPYNIGLFSQNCENCSYSFYIVNNSEMHGYSLDSIDKSLKAILSMMRRCRASYLNTSLSTIPGDSYFNESDHTNFNSISGENCLDFDNVTHHDNVYLEIFQLMSQPENQYDFEYNPDSRDAVQQLDEVRDNSISNIYTVNRESLAGNEPHILLETNSRLQPFGSLDSSVAWIDMVNSNSDIRKNPNGVGYYAQQIWFKRDSGSIIPLDVGLFPGNNAESEQSRTRNRAGHAYLGLDQHDDYNYAQNLVSYLSVYPSLKISRTFPKYFGAYYNEEGTLSGDFNNLLLNLYEDGSAIWINDYFSYYQTPSTSINDYRGARVLVIRSKMRGSDGWLLFGPDMLPLPYNNSLAIYQDISDHNKYIIVANLNIKGTRIDMRAFSSFVTTYLYDKPMGGSTLALDDNFKAVTLRNYYIDGVGDYDYEVIPEPTEQRTNVWTYVLYHGHLTKKLVESTNLPKIDFSNDMIRDYIIS